MIFFQINVANESAVRMEVDFPFQYLRDLSKERFGFFWWQNQKLATIPECYMLPEQPSVLLDWKLHVQVSVHLAILIL